MKIRYVDDPAGLEEVASALEQAERIALDSEAAGYHRYSDRICLVQVSAGTETFLVDPLAVDPSAALRPTLERADVEVVMHGADYDVRLLHRDLGIGLRGLFDTQIAASLLGIEGLGLSALLESRLGIHLPKKFQKADWATRPLPEPMREYAAQDTEHLPALRELLAGELERTGRLEWATEEFGELEKVRFDGDRNEDPVARIRAARELEPREVDRLREALVWRDGIARAQDRALFRVVQDPILVDLARRPPTSVTEMEDRQGMNGSLARRHGGELLERFRRVDALQESELRGYPRPPRTRNGHRGRPGPEVDERVARLKSIRNARAQELGMEKGTLLPNSVLQLLAESPPGSAGEIVRVPGVRRWQAALLADELMKAL